MLATVRRITPIFQRIIQLSSSSKPSQQLINVPPSKYADNRPALKENVWRDVDPTHQKSKKTHLSNGEELIHKVPVIRSHSAVVRCIGGAQLGAGHPQVYIQLDTREGKPVPCKYCGLRYALDSHHHH